jgi:hypothetical protein
METYHIQKQQKIQDRIDTIYYEGFHKWTTIFENRKKYTSESNASEDIYGFGGDIVSE